MSTSWADSKRRYRNVDLLIRDERGFVPQTGRRASVQPEDYHRDYNLSFGECVQVFGCVKW